MAATGSDDSIRAGAARGLSAFGVMASRILAVLAAICLVGAFALGTLLPPDLSLMELLAMLDHPTLVAIQNAVRAHMSDWTWTQIAVPLLARPCWLLPTELGLVFGGLAVTLVRRQGAPRSRRRRS